MFDRTFLRSYAPNQLPFVSAGTMLALLLTCPGASAGRPHTLSSFCAKLSCSDGSSPSADLIMDAAGNLYGTTLAGGDNSSGTLFRISRDANGKWHRKVLHSFCSGGYPCSDGAAPAGKLVIDTSGNVYGTALSGGGDGNAGGVVFEAVPDSAHNKWSVKILYAFCAQPSCADGKAPSSGLTYEGASSGTLYDGQSPLYGSTEYGGAANYGTAFRIQPSNGGWDETVIYDFCSKAGCADGAQPWQGLVMNSSGDIFGVTYGRSAPQYGVVFELSGRGDRWRETVLHTFCQQENCADGYGPNGVSLDSKGAIYGTAYGGGSNGGGTLFRILPRRTDSPYTVLYNFCSGQDCDDGAAPSADLAVDARGNLYGTTYYGGSYYIDRDGLGGGTLFRLTKRGIYTVLHNFCESSSCADGEYPNAGVLLDRTGSIFGTTQLGGKHGSMYLGGTAFQLGH
ncbi:MAG: hypothetical protein JOY77_12115 [Alphaproteobacteria bacterium]|nr:hypothetical protein [Alphaproteobacteria bacterium]MBV9063655.1 hypothetical protein [Alphaproteobacteria bacterium]